jgi:N utilization substance protein A
MGEFGDKQDEMLVGTVALEDTDNYYIDLGRTNGILPKKDTIPGEKIEMGSQIKVYVTKVDNNGKSLLVLLSRTHYGFVKRLFELEIPELSDGTVLLYSVARDAGNRSKVAVYSEYANIDPIGACIGEKGSRIARIINELGGEKIDVVRYDKDPAVFIANALAPAKNLTVLITDPKKQEAMVVADDDNFSLAIGKKGQNARLASRLTRYKIDIKNREQASAEGINIRTEE